MTSPPRRHEPHPATEGTDSFIHPREPRRIAGMERSPPERPHHDPADRPARAGGIEPAARDPGAVHKEPVRRAHDGFWWKQKRA